MSERLEHVVIDGLQETQHFAQRRYMLRMQAGWMDGCSRRLDDTGAVLTVFLCKGLNQPLQIKPFLLDLIWKLLIGLQARFKWKSLTLFCLYMENKLHCIIVQVKNPFTDADMVLWMDYKRMKQNYKLKLLFSHTTRSSMFLFYVSFNSFFIIWILLSKQFILPVAI